MGAGLPTLGLPRRLDEQLMSGPPATAREIRKALIAGGIACPVSVRTVGMAVIDTGSDDDLGRRVKATLESAGYVADLDPARIYVFRRS